MLPFQFLKQARLVLTQAWFRGGLERGCAYAYVTAQKLLPALGIAFSFRSSGLCLNIINSKKPFLITHSQVISLSLKHIHRHIHAGTHMYNVHRHTCKHTCAYKCTSRHISCTQRQACSYTYMHTYITVTTTIIVTFSDVAAYFFLTAFFTECFWIVCLHVQCLPPSFGCKLLDIRACLFSS